MMEIEMARGDLTTLSFRVLDEDKEPFLETFDNIYMTVKRSYKDKGYKFQKRLSDGGINEIGDGVYEFSIRPEDTDGLEFGNYDFDIELVIDGELKKTFVGVLRLTKETTHGNNEVAS